MDTITFKSMRIGDVLKEYGAVTNQQLEQALAYQQRQGIRLGKALIELGMITECQMLDALAESLELRRVDIDDLRVDIQAVQRIPRNMAERYDMLAIREDMGRLVIVSNDPMNFYGIEDVRQTVGMELTICLCELEPLQKAIQYYYSEVTARAAAEAANHQSEQEDWMTAKKNGSDTLVASLLDSLVRRAYAVGASDIHIEPFEKQTRVRMRIDGMITDYMTLKKSLHNMLVTCVKILGDLNITEHRAIQDGHFRMLIQDVWLNVRISIVPTVFGEKTVLRLLTNNSSIDHSETFGMRETAFQRFNQMLRNPTGIVYLTGPTGSGKSTTLYMILEALAHQNVNISTIEDPVEKNVDRVNQMQVHSAIGLTFEEGLRALLRQDPDIIMVGETRDFETANISVRAAITGHLVFSTLHTNDAPSAVVRLADMGLERYMIASSLTGVVAQRLVRKLCPYCAQEAEPTDLERQYLGKSMKKIKRAKGCHRCRGTGYYGRTAIHEIMLVDSQVRKMIVENASVEELRNYAVECQGMQTLYDCGVELVIQGITTMEEFNRAACYG